MSHYDDLRDCDYTNQVTNTISLKDNTNPSHYTSNKIECIDYIVDSLGTDGAINFCQGNVVKYLHRWKQKNGLEDLKKAQWYLTKMIELKGK